MQALVGAYKGEDIQQQVEERISEHASWVQTNNAAQLAAYTDFVSSRMGDSSAAPSAAAAVITSDRSTPSSSSVVEEGEVAERETGAVAETSQDKIPARSGSGSSLALLDALNVGKVTTDLETRVQNVVRVFFCLAFTTHCCVLFCSFPCSDFAFQTLPNVPFLW